MLLAHIPDKGEHTVRYYGYYSNQSRGERRLAEQEDEDDKDSSVEEGIEERVDPELSKNAKSAWARLIKQVYEVDPMLCPKCGGEMRIMAIIEEDEVIEKILRHLKHWDPRPPSQAPPLEEGEDWPVNSQIPLIYCPLPDIA